MRYELRVTAYDCLDQIVISTVLSGSSDNLSPTSGESLVLHSSIRGTGQLEPREWARDALLAALEDL